VLAPARGVLVALPPPFRRRHLLAEHCLTDRGGSLSLSL
jgi:hypothetical protein